MTDRIEAAWQAGHQAAMADAQRCKAGAYDGEGKWRSGQHFSLPADADERAAWMRGYGQQFAYWGGDKALQIVEALAASEPPLDGELGWCLLCKSEHDDAYAEQHRPDCPWRMAREWVSPKGARVNEFTGTIRQAVVHNADAQVVRAYLPSNYTVVASDADTVTIEGQDVAGWTLDDYVIPRLGSGLIFAEEVE